MTHRVLYAALVSVALALVDAPLLAQAPPTAPASGSAPAVQTTPPSDAERVDVNDIIRRLRHKPPAPPHEAPQTRIVFAPIISSKPSTGTRFGVGANLEIPLAGAGSRLSSLNTSFTISTKGRLAANFQPLLFGGGERWLVVGENQFTPTDVSDVSGGVLASPDANDVTYDLTRFFDTYARQVARHLYAGVGLFYARQASIDVPEGTESDSPFVAYSLEHGFDLQRQVAAGPGISLIFDSRDYPNDAGRGMLADINYRMYVKDFLGGDSTWQRLLIDVRAYRTLTSDARHRVTAWGFADLVTSGTAPYLSRPAIGADLRGRSGRGYREGQIRGDRLVYFEGEYRTSLMRNGLMGLVIFANATTAADDATSVGLFDKVSPGGGAGWRLLLHKRSRANLTVDVGFGERGSSGVYVALSDTF